jgi:hypothetical protein
MGQESVRVSPLTWEQAVQVAMARLEAEATCREARRQHSDDAFWPLGRGFLEKTFQENRRSLTARHLILACAVQFQRLQKGELPEPNDTPEPGSTGELPSDVVTLPSTEKTPTHSEEVYERGWQKQRKRFLDKLSGVVFDTVMAISLPWLAEVTKAPLVREGEHPDGLGDVNLVFRPSRGGRLLGVSFCNHDPRHLWRRLDRLLAQWQAAKGKALGALVALRSAAERTTDTANERFARLK